MSVGMYEFLAFDYRVYSTKVQHSKPGFGVDICDGDAQHFGATLLQRGEYVMHELEQLQQRRPENVSSEASRRFAPEGRAENPLVAAPH